ncbi:hypothetical protein, partial [Paenibacillus borealis]|uniref:hypothetical protein n=1 Tax=Paenibacillus borealis TaxID=160799 RepID=UPI001C4CBF44
QVIPGFCIRSCHFQIDSMKSFQTRSNCNVLPEKEYPHEAALPQPATAAGCWQFHELVPFFPLQNGGYYNRKEFRSRTYNAGYIPYGYKH